MDFRIMQFVMLVFLCLSVQREIHSFVQMDKVKVKWRRDILSLQLNRLSVFFHLYPHTIFNNCNLKVTDRDVLDFTQGIYPPVAFIVYKLIGPKEII